LSNNISGSRQNIKNLVVPLLGKGSSYLLAKNKLSGFKTEGAFHVMDRKTSKNNLTLVVSLNSSNNIKARKKFIKLHFCSGI